MKNVKAAGQSELLSEMVKPACQAGLEIITYRMDQIIVEVIPAELQLSDIFNDKKEKDFGNSWRSYRWDNDANAINQAHFGFMSGYRTRIAIFILQRFQGDYLAKKRVLYFAFIDLEKTFKQVHTVVILWALGKLGVGKC